MRNTFLFTLVFLFMSFVLTAQTEEDPKDSEKVTKESELKRLNIEKKGSKQIESEVTNSTDPINVKNDIYMVQGKGGNIGLSF